MVLNEAISELSTGIYYNRIEDWYKRLQLTLKAFDVIPEPMPRVQHTDNGQDFITTDNFYIFFAWHKMQSGRWEIICYKT